MQSFRPAFRFGRCGGSALLVAALAAPATASAAELRVEVRGLRSQAGDILVAVCTEASFLRRGCAHTASAPASQGVVVLRELPEGVYAVQAIHDEDRDGDLRRPGLLPEEGIGFSRDAPIRYGPPRFRDAAIEIRPPGATITLTMRYLD